MRLQCKGRSRSRPGGTGRADPRAPGLSGLPFGLLLLVLAFPARAASQTPCVEFPPSAAPSLEGYASLFRQAGVAFLARIEGEPPPPRASLALVNENSFPVTVDFTTQLAVGADPAPPREVPLGRRCVRLAARQTVELPATPEGTGAGEPIREVRVLNLGISGLTAAAPAPPSAGPAAPSPAPGDPAPADPSAAGAQFRCAEAPEGSVREACTAAYLAASARAATLTGAFAGTTRACLLEYAALQERNAELLRRGDPPGETPLDRVPPCFSRESARWDFSMLERLCPGASWTPENRGLVDCETPGVVVGAPVAAPPPPDPTPPRESAPPPSGGEAPVPASPRAEIDLQRVLRLLFGTILSMAGLGLLVPVLQALALLLVVVPAAFLRRAVGAAVPK